MKSSVILSRFILGSLLCLAVSQAHAYKYVCSHVFETKYDSDANLAPQSEAYAKFISQHVNSKSVLEAMARYQKLMGFETIDQKGQSLDLVKVKFAKLSPEQKREMMNLVHDIYNDVKLLKYSKEGPVKFFKRHLDVMVSEYSNVRSWFKYMMIDRQASLEKTLDMYFKHISELTNSPIALEGADVLLTGMRLQEKFLVQDKLQGPIVLYGSFANGKAYEKTSDLDFAVMDAKLETAIREFDTQKMLEEFQFSDAQAHVIKPKDALGLGYLNPVVITVKEKIIEVRVYGSSSEKDHQKGKVPFDVYYF
ncbi:hypothetical protein B9G69_003645 [Bdellovibrio sp. SKB1291214]|uniref:hypothetical protein n=1 Tax=Bdellovibrio sp. SKB1291214 TaxID=1732569 RepID=UPI000B517EF1|nr:hypothetical protein [Bdellovibrio sp. SKB1291214]UYL09666.1 hypothetical protein B9G69_003645 [Bdellovibrio sp. SKB1291214]